MKLFAIKESDSSDSYYAGQIGNVHLGEFKNAIFFFSLEEAESWLEFYKIDKAQIVEYALIKDYMYPYERQIK
tara:strand:- start:684 stop:902 length:219 start_codon:yes stop_codon:yes gene_type:complete